MLVARMLGPDVAVDQVILSKHAAATVLRASQQQIPLSAVLPCVSCVTRNTHTSPRPVSMGYAVHDGCTACSQPLMDAGLDSLGAVELRASLESAFAMELPATVTFDHPSVAALAAHIAGRSKVPAPTFAELIAYTS